MRIFVSGGGWPRYMHMWEAPDYLRVRRYVAIPNATLAEFDNAQRHAVEQNVHKMNTLADVNIRNCATVTELEGKMKQLIGGKA